ncbi:MAG: capsule assembly Wzi family protein [Steroidobacteraceae bacterium]
MKPSLSLAVAVTLGLSLSLTATARGVTPYLPLNLSPDIERQIERVLVLGGKPVIRRPIPAALVLDALPAACKRDAVLCERVRRYLNGYMESSGVTSLRPKAAITTGDSTAVLPNQHGQSVDSAWQVSASAYWQPSDFVLVNLGVVGHDDNVTATGSFLSFGFEYAQADIGFRDHWLSPLADSSSLIGTEAPTPLSATLSNYTPITGLGLGYEVFFAELSRQEGIPYLGTTTSGRPRLGGIQLSMEPASGYSVAVNRLVQYGGGARNGGLISQYFDEMFQLGNRNDLGVAAEETNRVASLTSSITFPGSVPFAARIEYAGEDNAYKGAYRLGATNLSLGLDFPSLWSAYDLTVEVSEWQNSWYVHPLYPEGLTNRKRVLGHWFGDNRRFGEAIGGRSFMVRAARQLESGAYLQATYRNLAFDPDWVRFDQAPVTYRQMQMLGLTYSRTWQGRPVDAELTVGRDVFGESFARFSVALDIVQAARAGAYSALSVDGDSSTEVFVDVGAQRSQVREIMLDLGPNMSTAPAEQYHAAFGARRAVARRHDIGVRLELDSVEGRSLVSVRALDYRYRFMRKAAIGAFFGAARYDLGPAAYGYYMGAGLQYLDLIPGWDLGLDFRLHEKLTRDKVLASDPPLTQQLPRRALDITGMSLYLSRKW